MNPIAILLASQRAVLVVTAAWIGWSIIGAISAPFAPNEMLLSIFVCTVVLVYGGCAWLIWPLLPRQIWLPLKIFLQLLIAWLPFMLILASGHAISNAVRQYFS